MWFAPTRYRDWYTHLVNQGSHGGLVGVGLAFLALAVFPPVWAWVVVALVYLGYEAFVQSGFDEYYRMTWDWRDSVDDTVNVLCGAGVLISALSWGYWTALTVFGIWAASLAFSVWRRV